MLANWREHGRWHRSLDGAGVEKQRAHVLHPSGAELPHKADVSTLLDLEHKARCVFVVLGMTSVRRSRNSYDYRDNDRTVAKLQ